MTTKKNTRFVAYDQLMFMHGDGEKYQTDAEHDEYEDYEYFDTEKEAAEWIKARLKQLADESDLYHITKTHHGLDTVEYHDLIIDKEVYDEDCDDWDVDPQFESGHSTTTLPDEILAKAKASERSYWKYLDYEEDTYHGIEE